MNYSIIGLKIGGTKQRRSGFTPLVHVGLLAGNEGDQMDRLTLVSEKPTYIIKHAKDYILYALIDTRVKSFDTDTSGVLSIALTIPSGMKLANGQSPYRLLKEAYDTFRTTYMEPLSDGRDSFKDVDYDKNIFQEIIDRYPLEPRSGKYVTMNPNGISGVVNVREDDLEEFFANSHYKEFAPYKEIEVGSKCEDKVSSDLKDIEIPLPPTRYYIYINGNNTGRYLQYPSDSDRISLPKSPDYTSPSIEFSLEDLWKAPNHKISLDGASAQLLLGEEKIDCILKAEPKPFFIRINHSGLDKDIWDKLRNALETGKVNILSGNQNVTRLCIGNGKILPEDIKLFSPEFKPSKVSIENDTYRMNIRKSENYSERELVLTITLSREVDLNIKFPDTNDSDHQINIEKHKEDSKKTKKEQADKNQENGKRKKNWLVWVIICVGVALLAVLIWFYIRMNQVDPPVVEDDIKEIEEIEKLKTEQEETNINPETVISPDIQQPIENPSPVQEAVTPPVTTQQKTTQPPVVNPKPTEKVEEPKTVASLEDRNLNQEIMDVMGNSSLSNTQKLSKVRSIWGPDKNKEYVSERTRNAIEAVLDTSKYKKYSPEKRKEINKIIDEHKSYNSLSEINNVHQQIIEIIG